MKILYIDESGTPELSSKDKFTIVCGVLIDEVNEGNFLFLIKRLKEKYNLSPDEHIHAVDIFENDYTESYLGTTRKRSKKDLRKKFQEEIWDLIKGYNVTYLAVCVPKDLVRRCLSFKKYPDKGDSWIATKRFYSRVDNQLPLDVGVNALYHWAVRELKNNGRLKIVFESRAGDPFTIRNYNLVADRNSFKNKHLVSLAKSLKKSVVSISFANKEVLSAGLELADIIAYTCNLYFLQNKKGTKQISAQLKNSISFKGIHKTLNRRHYNEINIVAVKKYIPGLSGRTKRIAQHYHEKQPSLLGNSLSPASAGAQMD